MRNAAGQCVVEELSLSGPLGAMIAGRGTRPGRPRNRDAVEPPASTSAVDRLRDPAAVAFLTVTTASRAYVSRLAGLTVFDPNGDRVGKVRDVVIALRVGTATPRVLGIVVEVVARRRIFVPMGRVTAVDPGAVMLASGTLNLKRFEQRAGETLVLASCSTDRPDRRVREARARRRRRHRADAYR